MLHSFLLGLPVDQRAVDVEQHQGQTDCKGHEFAKFGHKKLTTANRLVSQMKCLEDFGNETRHGKVDKAKYY